MSRAWGTQHYAHTESTIAVANNEPVIMRSDGGSSIQVRIHAYGADLALGVGMIKSFDYNVMAVSDQLDFPFPPGKEQYTSEVDGLCDSSKRTSRQSAAFAPYPQPDALK